MDKWSKEFKAYLSDPEINPNERLFLVLSVVALGGMLMAVIGGIIINENIESIIFTTVVFLVFSLIVYFGYRTKKVNTAATIVSALLVFGSLPVTFFTSGGVYGGAPIWCVFSTLYISMILSGRTRIVFFALDAIIISICWYTHYTYPQSVIRHTRDAVFADSLGSLLIVSIVMMILISFQTGLYKIENARAQQQKQQIEELNAAQNRFFSSMSHEIRTPINTIIGLNEMILRENASEEINDDAENIKAASTMLLHLINDILDVSKLESGQMELDIHIYKTADMLSDIVAMFWHMAKEKGLDFTMDIAPDVPAELSGDEMRIRQILINVINNAIKYTPKGSVAFSVQIEKGQGNQAKLIYTVTDTGIGIRKESIPYLFTAFTRISEDGTRLIEGTGLGLSIVKQFVDLMGGTISVNSIYTKGSTFIIEIPQRIIDGRAMEDIFIERRKDPARRAVYKQSFEAPEAKVLVVDDTEANLLVVQKLLRATKVQITLARSGIEALRATLDESFDVILMDHMMPGMDGIECMHRIKSQTGGMSKDARVVALTANAEGSGEALYNREGFDGYLVKPVTGSVLEEELLRLLPKNLVGMVSSDDNIIEESIVEESTFLLNKDYRKKSIVAITTESTADIPPEVIAEYDIKIIPYRITTETGIFRDGIDLQTDGLLAYTESGHEAVSDPPEVDEYERFFANSLETASNVIHLATSSGIRKCGCQNAIEAARSFDNVFVIDTEQITGGICLLAMEACRLAKEGRGPAYIKEWLEHTKDRVHTHFIVDDINYIGGLYEFKSIALKIARAFMLRPVFRVYDGRLVLSGIKMGTINHARKSYIAGALSAPALIDKSVLMIVHTGFDVEELEWVREQVESQVKFNRVIFQCASPAIAVNCGPGALALLYKSV